MENQFYSDSENEGEEKEPVEKKKGLWNKFYKFMKKANEIVRQDLHEEQETQTEDALETDETLFLFGQTASEQEERMKAISPFGQLPKYRLVHMMVKTFDDLRQQSFAMQLLQEFNRIFAMERLDIRVIPYEVLPLDKDSGIIEFMKDAITIDELRKR